jgi:hypothetical protein
MFLHDVTMVLLRRVFVLCRQDISLPLTSEHSSCDSRSQRMFRIPCSDLPTKYLRCFRTRDVAEGLVALAPPDFSIRADLELAPTDRPSTSFFEKRTATVLSLLVCHARDLRFSRGLFVPMSLDSHCSSGEHHAFFDRRAMKARTARGSNRTYLPSLIRGRRSEREWSRERVCSYTQLAGTFRSLATSCTVSRSSKSVVESTVFGETLML